jgi:citrate synthase
MAEKKLGGAGLRGQSAGETALCTVGKEGSGLTYRGYGIDDLAANAQFEEVAYMLLYGELPSKSQLADYIDKLTAMRGLPDSLKAVLEATWSQRKPSLSNKRQRTACWPRCQQLSVTGIALPMMAYELTPIPAKPVLAVTF